MTAIDYLIVLVYFLIVIGLGFWFQKKASKNIKAYFLGGNNMHWLWPWPCLAPWPPLTSRAPCGLCQSCLSWA